MVVYHFITLTGATFRAMKSWFEDSKLKALVILAVSRLLSRLYKLKKSMKAGDALKWITEACGIPEAAAYLLAQNGDPERSGNAANDHICKHIPESWGPDTIKKNSPKHLFYFITRERLIQETLDDAALGNFTTEEDLAQYKSFMIGKFNVSKDLDTVQGS